MRNGPEIRITGNVTTVTANTSVVITEQREESEDKNLQTAARVITLTQTLTGADVPPAQSGAGTGWRVGEKVEVIFKSLGG
jgi:hypothetical protein